MFPDPKNTPAFGLQSRRNFQIASAIALYLCVPILPVRRRPPITTSAPVPEATIHEYRKHLSAEHEVRLSRQRLIPAPASDPRDAKKCDELQFRRPISFRPNQSHHCRALFWSPDIGHSGKKLKFYATERDAEGAISTRRSAAQSKQVATASPITFPINGGTASPIISIATPIFTRLSLDVRKENASSKD